MPVQPAINPFEAPKADVDNVPSVGGAGPWSDGAQKLLVTTLDAVLPERCLRCNRPTEGHRQKRVLYWHTPALFVLAISPIIYLIVALIVRKKATVIVGLCPDHRRRRRNDIFIAVAWALGSLIGLPVIGITFEAPVVALVGLLGFVGAMIFVVYRVNLLRPKSIDKRYAFLQGASPEFLRSLEPFRGGSP